MYFINIKTHRIPKRTLHFTAKLNLQNSSQKNLIEQCSLFTYMYYGYLNVLWTTTKFITKLECLAMTYKLLHRGFLFSFFNFAKVNFFAKLLTLTYGNTCNNDFILITIKPPICYKKKNEEPKMYTNKNVFYNFLFYFLFLKITKYV